MPGKTSLKLEQYYAHSRNLFWQFLFTLTEAEPTTDYARRLELLQAMKIGLWDVLAKCQRPGSLDTDIVKTSEQANDIPGLLKKYPNIHRICFNGQKAYKCFKRYVLKKHPEFERLYDLRSLPSTSPANASIDYQTRFVCWKNALVENRIEKEVPATKALSADGCQPQL
jgi:TDG/mug DNA glycosylase family protein